MAEISAIEAENLVGRHVRADRSLLDVLHAIQDETGYVPSEALGPLARAMNLSRADVYGVVTYYHFFRSSPPPRVVVQLCRAESCQSKGTEKLAEHIEARTGCKFDAHSHTDTHADASSNVELVSVYCLGQCALSPSMFINDQLHARMTPERFDRLFDAVTEAVTETGNASDRVNA